MSLTLQECSYALPYAPICCCLPKWLPLPNSFTVPILRSGTLQGIAQAPPYSVPTPNVKYGVPLTAPPSAYMRRNSRFLLYINHHVDSCASCIQTEAVLSYTGERRCNVWKLHFVRTTLTLPYPPPMGLQAL